MEEDPLTDLRHTEEVIRKADRDAHAALADAKRQLDTSQEDDRFAYAQALVDRQGAPKARASKLRETIRDLETRVIPGADEALWLLAGKVRLAARPDADANFNRRLDSTLLRWQAPDPNDLSKPAPTNYLSRRPQDVVSWVLSGIAKLDRQDEERADREGKKARYEAAKRKVDAAQVEHEARERQRLAEFTAEHPFVNVNPPALFNCAQFLIREGLAEDYGLVGPGSQYEVKGGREHKVEFVPAQDLVPVGTEA